MWTLVISLLVGVLVAKSGAGPFWGVMILFFAAAVMNHIDARITAADRIIEADRQSKAIAQSAVPLPSLGRDTYG